MKKSAAVFGGLLVCTLGFAWWEWTVEPSVALDGQVLLMSGTSDEIEQVVWKSKKDEATLVRKTDARGPYLWVDYTKWERELKPHPEGGPGNQHEHSEGVPEALKAGEETEAAPVADGEDPAAATDAEPPVEVEEELPTVAKRQAFKAGENGDSLLDSLSPFVGIRQLEGVDDAKLVTIGLDEPEDSLEITRRGRTTVFDVGGEAYGTRDRYIRDRDSGAVYLVDDEVLRPLRYARTRLPDRRLTVLERVDLVGATITNPVGASVEVHQKNKDDQQQALWVRSSAPDEVDEQLKTWMDKALKLKGTSYAKPDDMPEDLELRFSISLQPEKGEVDSIEVLQQGEDGDFWARSPHTRGLIKLLRGPTTTLADDLDDLVDGA